MKILFRILVGVSLLLNVISLAMLSKCYKDIEMQDDSIRSLKFKLNSFSSDISSLRYEYDLKKNSDISSLRYELNDLKKNIDIANDDIRLNIYDINTMGSNLNKLKDAHNDLIDYMEYLICSITSRGYCSKNGKLVKLNGIGSFW